LRRTDNVGALLRHVDEVTAGTVGELDGVDGSLLHIARQTSSVRRTTERRKENETNGSNNISDVGNRSSRGGTEVKDLLSGTDVNVVETTEDTGGQLGAERVPHAVLDLLGREGRVGVGLLDRDALLAVDRVTGDEVAGDEEVLLALGDEDSRVTVRLEDHLRTGSTLGTDTTASSTATATSGSSTTSSS
jgi:hypothetical protein